MQDRNQISSHQNSTLCNAEIVDFRHPQNVDYQHSFSRKNLSPSTGKEKDSESGFYYFGARYYDCDLSGLFLSVDPMSDKYPSLSPYAYCAWNPVKLVDPDGEDIDVSSLDDNQQKRLINCLSEITGLSLFVKDGKLKYDDNINSNKGSQKAKKDLQKAIDDELFVTAVTVSNHGSSNRERGIHTIIKDEKISELHYDAIMGLNFNSNQEDNSTYGLGMEFMHEMLHCYFNFKDPTNRENNTTFQETGDGHIIIKRPIEKTLSYFFGKSVVGRVNEYRRELGLDCRVTYASDPDKGVPFRNSEGRIYWIKKE